MSLENYLAKSHERGQEIRLAFPKEQQQPRCNLLKEIGWKKYLCWVREHLEDILKYISLSPSQREKKKWANHPDILLIRCAAIQISGAAEQFLSDIEPIAGIVDNGSYRQFHTVIAQGIAPLMLSFPLAKFPFEGVDNPFQT
jgi:hypothetical protein